MIQLYDLSTQGHSMRSSAESLGLSFDRVKYLAERYGIKFSGHARKYIPSEIRAARLRGLSFGQISQKFGISASQACRICNSSSDER